VAKDSQVHLTRRERQIMDVVYRLGRATAAEVLTEMPDPPGYSSVRTLLRLLEAKASCATKPWGRATSTFRRSRATKRAARRCGTSCARSSTARRKTRWRRCSISTMRAAARWRWTASGP